MQLECTVLFKTDSFIAESIKIMCRIIHTHTKKEIITILRATHKYKDSREQFEQRTHKRLIDIVAPTQKTVDALSRLEMPAGVSIDIKMKNK